MSEKSPDAFRTISEVAEDLDLPPHVLRFWETKFSQIRPTKRASGRRFYRPEDVALVRSIRDMLYGQGYTIRGVQRLLKERRGATAETSATVPLPEPGDDAVFAKAPRAEAPDPEVPPSRPALQPDDSLLDDLRALRADVDACASLLADARRPRL